MGRPAAGPAQREQQTAALLAWLAGALVYGRTLPARAPSPRAYLFVFTRRAGRCGSREGDGVGGFLGVIGLFGGGKGLVRRCLGGRSVRGFWGGWI